MDQKTTREKLQILLPHWIEHNHNHEAEFKKWADLVRTEGQGGLAELLDKAVASMGETDSILQKVLAEIGGPGEGHCHHHHPHHHD
ncbi:MAG: hypothetical protein A2512_12495 [Deltaproteobacteria bacterium RIFOXYD12_FULL_56_24]|nr:MAG: hypothetical protein A2512_12495 [Deltaproteobacteria bacterium RIFOXYD12_FULL_56_24]